MKTFLDSLQILHNCIIIIILHASFILQQSKSQQIGKSVARDLVTTFKDRCVTKVKDKKVEFGPRQLEAGYVLYNHWQFKRLVYAQFGHFSKTFDILTMYRLL